MRELGFKLSSVTPVFNTAFIRKTLRKDGEDMPMLQLNHSEVEYLI